METDPARIPYYIIASTFVMALVIWCVATWRGGERPAWWLVLLVAGGVSALGIGFAKYGANFGLPWWIFYTVPMLATVLLPPIVFRFSLMRCLAYVVMAFLSAPIIHAGFFYALGWGDYMPFLRLPAL
jgi:hypothetical protein